jgi:hypothetical protein
VSKPKDRNTKLMEACGSKNGQWDPEAPDQNLYRVNHGAAEEQYVSFVYANTCGQARNSPFAVDEHGDIITLKRVAARFKWQTEWAEYVAREAEKHGRVVRDPEFQEDGSRNPKRRLWYRADVPAARVARKTIATPAIEGVRTHSLPPYVINDLMKLGPEKCRNTQEWYDAFCVARNASFAEVKLSHWDAWDQLLLDGLERAGVKPHKLGKRAPRDPVYIRAPLDLEIPPFVLTSPSSFVRDTPYTVETGLYENPGPLSHTDQTSKDLYSGTPSVISEATVKQSAAAAALTRAPNTSPPPPLIDWMRQGLKAYPGAKGLAGEPDDAICRRCLSAGTPDEVSAALVCMHKAGKAPLKSWAWFTVDIIRQHIPRRKKA